MPVMDRSSQWRARREGYRRLGHNKKRRLRDRNDISGMPDVVGERGRYGFLYKGSEMKLPKSNVAQRYARKIVREMPDYQLPEFVGMASYVAKRFAKDLEKAVVEGVLVEMERALKLVRKRAELQVGHPIAESGSEAKFLREMKMYVARNVQHSAQGWEEELRLGLQKTRPAFVWKVLVDKETLVMQHATTAARTLLGATYNSYMGFLMAKDKQLLFEWFNLLDARTTPCCRALVAATAGGVPMDKLKALVQQYAEKSFWSPKSPLLPHFNCRSTFVVVK